jgi:hypothetical protein
MSQFSVTLEPWGDGLHNRLLIQGGIPGAHQAYVTTVPEGRPLARLNWNDVNGTDYVIANDVEKVRVQIDLEGRSYPADAKYRGEQHEVEAPKPDAKPPAKRRSDPPRVIVPAESARSTVAQDALEGVADADRSAIEKGRAVVHEVSAAPGSVKPDRVAEARIDPPAEPPVGPRTNEEKVAEHEAAVNPTQSEVVDGLRKGEARDRELVQEQAKGERKERRQEGKPTGDAGEPKG